MGCRVGGLQGTAMQRLSGFGRRDRMRERPGAGESVRAAGRGIERLCMWVEGWL